MKIVNLQKFLKMPAGTLFATYIPHSYEFGPLTIKDDTWKEGPNNFFFQELLEVSNDGREMIKILDVAVGGLTSFNLDLSEPGRIGPWDEDTLFAVYEPADAKQLITRLLKAFGESGLMDRALVEKIDQVITPTRLEEAPSVVGMVNPSHKAAYAALAGLNVGPSPGTEALVVSANAETANRRCVHVIRPDKNGVEVNYGRLAVGHVEGIPFVAQVESLITMGIPCIYVERIPKFVQDITLVVKWIDNGTECEATFYALEKEDLAPLGLALSKNDCAVMATYMGCFLQVWANGKAASERKTIDHFVHRMSPEEIEASKF
jgi:hypothetical protein